MCDCMERIKEQAKENFMKDAAPKITNFFDVVSSNFEDEAIWLTDKDNPRRGLFLASPLSIKYRVKTKAGKILIKNKTYNMTHKYCPFCGKLNYPEENQSNATTHPRTQYKNEDMV